ncbi:MAG: type I-F CRISPR-associated protein Csy1, partial [Burkholderiales bacterium]|nr:type I-F CRISPR-associated protein Csy1 [Burkholderiales bacterium]
MTANILNFLNDRKEQWLKEKLKKVKNETECLNLTQQANHKFSLEQWLPDAAKRGNQLFMVSHPSKFSHPSAKTSSVLAFAQLNNDGYLRSGNIAYPLDVFGNAAAMDVYKFLMIPLSNKKNVLECLEQDDEIVKSLISGLSINYEELKANFLSIKEIDSQIKTDRLVKQVYFPTLVSGYHLLSMLTPSGLLTE